MKQINNNYADYYYLLEDGKIYNAAADKIMQPNKDHIYTLKTVDNKTKKIALKTIYRLVYNKPYCIDNIESLEGEEWREIEDTDGLYYCSNKGRIKSLQGYEAIILKPLSNNKGYQRVDIVKGGKRTTKLIHRLVAAAFLSMPEKLEMQLHHKNFDRSCNDASNLEWLTIEDHIKKHKERSLINVSPEPEKDND